MHMFNMLIIPVLNFKSIAKKPWKELITQTCYPMLKANLKIVQVEYAIILSKNYFLVCTNSHAYLRNACNICAKF